MENKTSIIKRTITDQEMVLADLLQGRITNEIGEFILRNQDEYDNDFLGNLVLNVLARIVAYYHLYSFGDSEKSLETFHELTTLLLKQMIEARKKIKGSNEIK